MKRPGFIKVFRSIQDNWLWSEKPYGKGQAWIDLLLEANFADAKRLINGEIITFERGQVYKSQTEFAHRWGWSRKKVTAFLKVLQSDGMITIKSTTKGTTITIENYELYQDSGTTVGTSKEHQKNIERTSKVAQEKKNKKNKNDKKNENTVPSCPNSDEPDELAAETELAEQLAQIILDYDPQARVPRSFKTWAKTIDRMIRIDKRTPEQILWLFRWSQNDEFWNPNIRSPDKLRKQWDKLVYKAKAEHKPKQGKDLKDRLSGTMAALKRLEEEQ